MLHRGLICALFVLAVSTARAEDQGGAGPSIPADRMPTVALSVEPEQVAVGEVVHWRIKIKRQADISVLLGKSVSFGDLEVRGKSVEKIAQAEGVVEEVLQVELVPFEAGEVVIPSQKLSVVDKAGAVAEIALDEVTIRVNSLIGNEPEAALKEDTGPGETVIVKDYLILYVLGSLLVIGVVAILTLLIRWLWARRRMVPEEVVLPAKPAEKIAMEKLETLRRSSLLEAGQIKEYYVRLSEAMREYFGNRYKFQSLELSSFELTRKLKKTPLGPDDYHAAVGFLENTDLVKFAKVTPPVQESRSLLEQSIDFVERTTRKQVLTPDVIEDVIEAESFKVEQELAVPAIPVGMEVEMAAVDFEEAPVEEEIDPKSRDTDPVPRPGPRSTPLKTPQEEEPETDPRLKPASGSKAKREATFKLWQEPPQPKPRGKTIPKPIPEPSLEADTDPRLPPVPSAPDSPRPSIDPGLDDDRATEPAPPPKPRPLPLKKTPLGAKKQGGDDA